jgi:catechol 2,3-dioxygenase-like lactoylglutathione lyase family enzyme
MSSTNIAGERIMEPLSLTAPTLLVENVARSVFFYRDRVGFELYRSNESFANFRTECAILALWEARHVERELGCKVAPVPDAPQRIILACEFGAESAVDFHYQRMERNGVPFLAPPKAFPWNVYAAYFADPDGYLWEIFAWREGGPSAGGHEIYVAGDEESQKPHRPRNSRGEQKS